jgi:hypothetical protein
MEQDDVVFQRVAIEPLDCLSKAKDLIGGQYWLFVGICTVGILIGSVVPLAVLMGPMFCGIFLCFFSRMAGEPVPFEKLFRGFDYFLESLIATLLLMAASMVVILPVYLLMVVGFIGMGAGGDDEMAAVFVVLMIFVYLLIFVASMLLGAFFSFVYPLIVDRGLRAIPAIKLSVRAVTANFGGVLGLMLLNGLISLAAALCCYLPVFLVSPICIGAVAVAYRKVFGEAPAPADEITA